MCSGKDYTEVRNFKRPYYMMFFYFVTRSYSSSVETIIADLYQHPADVITMNSCLWDITRYGKEAMEQYRLNLQQNLIESSYKLTVLQTLIPSMLKSNTKLATAP